MLLSVLIILIVGLVAYFHYVQGFFSATISAIAAIIAAALAISYHEPLVLKFLGGKFADIAPGMALCVLFAVIYLAIRTATDKFVPGNLRLPVLAEKIGAGVMGLVAGIFCGGVVAIAAQSLPFGATVGGFSRYETTGERDVQLPTSGQTQDVYVHDALKDPDIDKNRSDSRQSLYVPADELVLAAVDRFSSDGSLAGARPLRSVHPDYVEELFLSNVGIQIGAKRSAINQGDKQISVSVPDKGLFAATSVTTSDGEIKSVRGGGTPPVPPTLTPKPNEVLLVTRVIFDRKATDADGRVRLSPGSARLVAGQGADRKNYYPLGTLENGRHLYANALDDHLVTDEGKGVDLVYLVPKADLLTDPKAGPDKKMVIADGVFLEVKRLARVDLSGKAITPGVTPSKDVGVLRKPAVVQEAAKAGAPAAAPSSSGGNQPSAAASSSAGPLEFRTVLVGPNLPHRVATGTADKSTNSFETLGAKGALQNGQFSKLEVNGEESSQRISNGPYALNELHAPDGQRVVQAHFTPRSGDNAWEFASQIASYALVDQSGQQHQPKGAVAKVKTPEGGDRLVARYNATSNVSDIPQVDGRPTDVTLLFTIPVSTQLQNLTFSGQPVAPANLTVN